MFLKQIYQDADGVVLSNVRVTYALQGRLQQCTYSLRERCHKAERCKFCAAFGSNFPKIAFLMYVGEKMLSC